MKTNRGFTLVEVLVAMAITAVVSVMAYYGIDSAIKLSQTAEKEADYLRQVNRAFDIIARDFRHITGRQVREPGGQGHLSALLLDNSQEQRLQLTRLGWTNPEPKRFQRSQLQRVHYNYEDEKLIRVSWQMLDAYTDSKEQKVTLLEQVKELSIRVLQQADISDLSPGSLGANVYINLPTSSTEAQWLEQWPPVDSVQLGQASSALPLAIEIKLDLQSWGEIRRVFLLVDSAGGDQW